MPRRVEVEHGRTLLNAVERILAPTDELVALADEKLAAARMDFPKDAVKAREEAVRAVIRTYSNRAGLVGVASTLPSTIPGIGTVVGIASGVLLDVGLLLKFEVELALVLSQLHGFDIRENDQRQLAFLMASVGTYEAQSGRNFVVDVLSAEAEALWNYTPRRVGKAILNVLGMMALMRLGRGWMRLVPLIGPLIGGATNSVLTRRVGEQCNQDLLTRRTLLERAERMRKSLTVVQSRPARKAVRAQVTPPPRTVTPRSKASKRPLDA